jgi:MFS family permease
VQQHDVTAAERTQPARTAPEAAHDRRRGAAFALLASVQFVLILAMSALNAVLPDIQHEFGLGRAELALLSASYGISFSGLCVGRLVQRFGVRAVPVAGLLLAGLGLAALDLIGTDTPYVGAVLAGLVLFPWPARGRRLTDPCPSAARAP